MLTPIVIAPMRACHLDDVMRIDRCCFSTPWERAVFQAELANQASRYLVAKIENRILGFGGETVLLGEAHISILAVSPEWRGKKIGERLLCALLEEALRLKAHCAMLEVRQSNLIAQNLYAKYGFRPVTLRPNYYTDNSEDAIVMRLDAMDAPDYRAHLQQLRNQMPYVTCRTY
ncbi:(SSU ribosomal protein S18P)-alanine acetyltransferase [Chthonomonas calidirosea]|uniref:Ribosomal-protein-alanine acetyltransferase n=1 Tax=Chthonomonas calidirosea (strain DSM 23976 / ICMP 18418 / T49) TaxID=1303518 RepID=S0EUD0_CHTCT|nr:ribosomal protein S18-alanine N-acetyltransferase [Chthonomonas calidirosea]CCW34879.1 ribosomal-protein-alanine acetyltransferase [Chthonomonas calidirosea T49]CEK12583.1 (SSU ribosomal protein S18P)-alanine acetyltransferase [Chthonomonas calidirosea]CEK13531.1 (SSU ribosomal protein S18P)-alanine acetyltransferase [Chthonomonas calidirosea]